MPIASFQTTPIPLAPNSQAAAQVLQSSNRPYVTLKAAATLDGKIATANGESQWITGPEAREAGHRLRSRHSAVLVGVGTVLADNPRLNVRLPSHEIPLVPPIRVVLDSHARTPLQAHVWEEDGGRRLWVVGVKAPEAALQAAREKGVEVLQAPTPRPELAWALPQLRQTGVNTLMVEGGGQVHASFLKAKMADELFLFLAGKLMGQAAAPGWVADLAGEGPWSLAQLPRLALSQPAIIGHDILIHGQF